MLVRQQSTQCAHPWLPTTINQACWDASISVGTALEKTSSVCTCGEFELTQAVGERLAGLLNDLLCVVLLPTQSYSRTAGPPASRQPQGQQCAAG